VGARVTHRIMHDSGKASQAKVCARMYHVMLTSRRWQMDPNDPNYDPDEDEPRRAPVDLHAGKDADVAAYKQAVRAPGACSKPDMLACSNGVVKCSRAFHAGRAGRCHPGGVLQQRRCWRDRHGSAGVAIMHCVAADAQFGNAVHASPHFNGMLADACEPVLCLCEGPAVFAGHLLVQGSWQQLAGVWVVAGACQARAQELGQPELHRLFVKRLVARAMDRHAREREMASSLLSTLYSQARCRGPGRVLVEGRSCARRRWDPVFLLSSALRCAGCATGSPHDTCASVFRITPCASMWQCSLHR